MNRVYFDTNIFEDIVKKVIDIDIDELNSFTSNGVQGVQTRLKRKDRFESK